MTKTGLVVGGIIGAAGLGAIIYEVTKKPSASSSTPTGSGGALVDVVFSGIEGQVTPSTGGALPALVTVLSNPTSATQQYTVSAAAGPITWTPSVSSFSLAAGATRSVSWSADWTSGDGTGPFQTTLTVEVA